jgi:RimJ/RimL family protein N-acetyltransferase
MLEGKRVRLIPLEKSHLGLLKNWRNDPAIRRKLFSFMPCTDLGQEIWYGQMIKEGRDAFFMIEAKDAGGSRSNLPLVGYCSISEIDWKKGRGLCGIVIGDEKHSGKGLGLESLYLLFDYAFSEMRLHKIAIYILSDNERSLKLFSKFARAEGTLVSHEFYDGKWKDVAVMGLTEEMYFSETRDRIRKLLE